jgi:hypothetical protein
MCQSVVYNRGPVGTTMAYFIVLSESINVPRDFNCGLVLAMIIV